VRYENKPQKDKDHESKQRKGKNSKYHNRWQGTGKVVKFYYLGSMITNVAKCHVEIKRRIIMVKKRHPKKKGINERKT